MATPPSYMPFRLEGTDDQEIPQAVSQALSNSSQTHAEVVSALTKGLTRADNFAGSSKEGLLFRAQSTGPITTLVAHGMTTPPRHRMVSGLERVDNVALAVWSYSSVLGEHEQVLFTFQGLVAGKQYRASFLFE